MKDKIDELAKMILVREKALHKILNSNSDMEALYEVVEGIFHHKAIDDFDLLCFMYGIPEDNVPEMNFETDEYELPHTGKPEYCRDFLHDGVFKYYEGESKLKEVITLLKEQGGGK